MSHNEPSYTLIVLNTAETYIFNQTLALLIFLLYTFFILFILDSILTELQSFSATIKLKIVIRLCLKMLKQIYGILKECILQWSNRVHENKP